MKKIMLLMITIMLVLSGCSYDVLPDDKEEKRKDLPETTVIRMALNESGHILNSIAESQGYLEEEGIRIEYVRTATDAEVFELIRKGEIDIASNSGTNLPLQEISSGMDLTIFGGYLLSGCMPIFARVETPWNGIEDLIGRTMACEPNMYAITGPLLDMGYDPLTQINWYNPEDQMDRIEAVRNGEADFALVGTALNYEVLNDPELKILTYADDVLPAYSCCRAEALTSWVNANPNTIKALLRAWIRAWAYYDAHHEETVQATVRQINLSEQVIRSYLDNPRFELNADPMKASVKRAWDYMERLGLLNEEARQIQIEDHINVDLYKAALDECQRRYGRDDPKFYEKLQAMYARNDH